VADAPAPERSLAQAVISALVLLGFIVFFNLLGPGGFFFLAAGVITVALFELFDALKQTGHRPPMLVGLAGGVAMMSVAYLEKPALILAALALTLYAAFLLALRSGRGPRAGSDVAWTMLGVTWIGGGGAAAVSILTFSEDGALLLTAYILITALSDIGGYFAGTAFGKHKMAPSISPAKSWEGFAGGAIACLLGGLLFGGMLFDLSLVEGLGLAVIPALLAPVGDLVESLVKREIGIKDSGRLLPGHGGLLDRLDAIIFCAPAAYLYLRFVVF
jgi:phosphatidate cytidylyltransferase